MKTRSPWTDTELNLIRDYGQKYCLKSPYELISEVKKINPSRSPMSVRSKLSQILRRERPITDGLRQRIREKWDLVSTRSVSATEVPSIVCYLVSIRIPIGLELFVKTCSEMGLLPIGADWRALVSTQKTCSRCGIKKQSTEFGLDPSTCEGLTHSCKLCSSKKRTLPMEADPLASDVSPTPPPQGGDENGSSQPAV